MGQLSMKLSVAFIFLVMCCSSPAQATPSLGDTAVAAFAKPTLDQTFTAIASGIRYEPYGGVLRGARATALAGGGNAADQSVLLAEVLRNQGYRVRFVRGTLDGDNLNTLIRGLYPPQLPTLNLGPEYAPFDPYLDKELSARAADHTWLELDQGDGNWLPLDPSFPRAEIGAAYAKAVERFDSLPEKICQRVIISLHEQTVGGKARELGRVEDCVAALALQPLSLRVLGVSQLKSPESKQKLLGTGDMFGGALSGAAPKQEAPDAAPQTPQPMGVLYQRQLQRGDEIIPFIQSLVLNDKAESSLRREWLRIEMQAPGAKSRVIERDLFVADSAHTAPALYRRYSVVILPGALAPEAVMAQQSQLRKTLDLPAAQQQIDAAKKTTTPDAVQIDALGLVDDHLGSQTGHWLGLRLGAEISTLTERLAFDNGVSYAQSLPRILIVSLEGDGDDKPYRSAIDLRLDEVDAWPYPGHAARAAQHFQTARGLQNSQLEGRFLERVLGQAEAASTMNLMVRVDGGQGALLMFGPGQASQLKQVKGLTPYAQQLIEMSLKNGHEVIVPPAPVQLAGRDRQGWWEREPQTGRVIGVMDDGLHSAMTEYAVNTEEIGLNDDAALVIGAMVGATSTGVLIAAKVLETGDMTGELVANIMKQLKLLKCMSCPEAKLKVKAAVTASEDDDCFIYKKDEGAEAKPISFCENYTRGMTCAATAMLYAYQDNKPKNITDLKFGIDAQLPCGD